MTVAHYLTLLRILLIPLFVAVYLHGTQLGLGMGLVPIVLLALAALSECSDACDGYLARKLNQVTDLGKILDPMADSLSRLAVYFCFTQGVVDLPLEFPLLMLYRDASVSTLRTICALKGFALAARKTGKFKAFIQAFGTFAILVMMALHGDGLIELSQLQIYSAWIAAVASIFSFYSGLDYVWANRHYVKRIMS